MKRVVCAIFAAMVSLGAVASTSILIAEENFEGAMSCRLASVGSFPVAPGIKSGMGVGGSCAYGFGRSSCNANAWDGYVNDLVFTFSKRYVITKVEFWEMERYDNWGSQGWLMADGIQIENTTFARLPSNDRIADSTFRKREFVLSNVISDGLTFRCWDITNLSELFIDNIKIYGYAYDDTSSFPAPSNLQATEYHNQHPHGVKLTWSPVAGAPGYVILRKIVGENDFYPVGATPDTEYINKVATIPNVKDLKAQYTVAVADWQGNDPNTIVYLSPQSDPAWGSWRENPPPTAEHLPPRVISMVKSNANPMLSGLKGANVYTLEFNDDYDTSGYMFKQAKITGVCLRNGKRHVFTSSTRDVTMDIPAGEHGEWSFEVRGVFTETASGKDYTTPIFNEGLDNVRVCFMRKGRDGVKVSKAKAERHQIIPNWFKYWLRDGALELLDDSQLFYKSIYENNKSVGGATARNGKIQIFDAAITGDYGMTLNTHVGTLQLQTSGLSGANCIYNCAEVIEHERMHRYCEAERKHGFIAWLQGGNDIDDPDHDNLSTDFEAKISFETALVFNPDNPDTFGFYNAFYGENADKADRAIKQKRSYDIEDCDEEVYVRYQATIGNRREYFASIVHADMDFSWEGNDGIPQRLLSVKSNRRLSSNNDDVLFDSGKLDDLYCFSGFAEALYADENISVVGVDSVIAESYQSDDKYDKLICRVRCSALQNDYGTIVITLADDLGTPVAWASRSGIITSGTNQYEIVVNGSVLHDSLQNGYTVCSVIILRGDGSSCVPRTLLNTSSSTPIVYKWSDFRTDNVTIQSLVLSEDNGCVNVSAEIVVPNEDGVYDLSTFLCDAGTSDYVAEASRTNVVLHAGTNAVSLAFANSDIQMNAVSNVFAISKFTVEKDGEIVAAYNGDVTLTVADKTILNPTNAVLAFDEATVTNELVASEGGALYSGVNFAFDVVNSHTNAVDYTLTAYLNSTNSLTVDMATFDLSLTSGVNRITIPFLGAKIRESGIDGPYVLSSVRLESKDEAIASQTLRMRSSTEDCEASNLQGDIITRLVGISRKSNRDDSIVASITFETAGAVSGIVNASLVDAENKVIMFGCTCFTADCAGVKNVEICFAVSNITESAYTMPLRVAYISVEPSDKLLPSLADDTLELVITELDYLKPVAAVLYVK